ncbi:Tuberculostearic acid methyltransferase [Nymphaea thermarum]|nr:Tuberculostearic acid methyltransferase [Nymphaea thermarum]
MLEAVGHEYMEEFFGCSESLLAEDGIFVLQFSSIPDQRYNEHRRSPGFMNVYIFPGGLLPSLSRSNGMVKSSIEHVENIGIYFPQTLLSWRRKFIANKSEILKLGFDEKFIRTWDYYFLYCAAGFKSCMLGDYQVKSFPSCTMHPLIKALFSKYSSISDQRYNEHRRSPGFMNIYIFPGGLLPSLSRVTSAMTTASRLWYDYLYLFSCLFSVSNGMVKSSIEHVKNIGIHFPETFLSWRRNFIAYKSEILKLGFDEKFIRTWDYYFLYCAAGLKSCMLGDYQVKSFPSCTMHPLIKALFSKVVMKWHFLFVSDITAHVVAYKVL